jgi:hypothetical protein
MGQGKRRLDGHLRQLPALKTSREKTGSATAQALVLKLQKNYYTCTDGILKGLGELPERGELRWRGSFRAY